jgi:hypothetical protein
MARSIRDRRLALLVGASLRVAHPAFAQPEGEGASEEVAGNAPAPVQKDPKVAKTWLKAAEQLIKKADQLAKQKRDAEAREQYENAATAYSKAIEAGEDIALNYQLALAEEKAGMLSDAVKHLKLLVAPGSKADVQKKAQAKLDDLAMKVGFVMLVITPDGTQVSIEGKTVAEAPLTEPLVLPPGTHKVSLTAVGFQPRDIDLKVEAGSESERKLALEPVPVVTTPEPEQPIVEQPVVKPTGPDMRPLYIGGGTAVGFALIATVTGIAAVSKHGTYTDARLPASERADARSSGKTFALVTDLCLVGALGAAAFTAYWYQFKYRPQARVFAERREAQAKVDVIPWVQPQAGGLSVAGSF